MSADEVLRLYVIFDHPLDFPEHVVISLQMVPMGGDGRVFRDPHVLAFETLDDARAWCARRGLCCLPRDPEDDPKIVETWI